MTRLALIGVDWGTTSVRVFGFDAQGRVIAENHARAGISAQHDGPAGYVRTLDDLTAGWDVDGAPILLCGMVGSDRGWREAPYRDLPLAIDGPWPLTELDIPGHRAAIVPGLRQADWPRGVLRGEETQLVGAAAAGAHLVIAPGSHSKWIRIADGTVADFVTFMTGEFYAALAGHTILQATVAGHSESPRGFAAGLEAALRDDSLGPLSDAFAVRSLALAGELDPRDSADFLSGLLVGAECRAGARWAPADPGPIALVCNPTLAERYRQALEAVGLPRPLIVPDAAARGLWELAVTNHII